MRSIYLSIYLWLYTSLLGLGRFFSLLIFYTVGRSPSTGDQPVTRQLPAHGTAQIQNKRTQTSIPQVGFEPKIPVFQRPKTVHAFDRAATVIGGLHNTRTTSYNNIRSLNHSYKHYTLR
jgi:hypothetical protein